MRFIVSRKIGSAASNRRPPEPGAPMRVSMGADHWSPTSLPSNSPAVAALVFDHSAVTRAENVLRW